MSLNLPCTTIRYLYATEMVSQFRLLLPRSPRRSLVFTMSIIFAVMPKDHVLPVYAHTPMLLLMHQLESSSLPIQNVPLMKVRGPSASAGINDIPIIAIQYQKHLPLSQQKPRKVVLNDWKPELVRAETSSASRLSRKTTSR